MTHALVQQQNLEELCRSYVQLVLAHFNGNKKDTCAFLNINYRTLQRKLDKV